MVVRIQAKVSRILSRWFNHLQPLWVSSLLHSNHSKVLLSHKANSLLHSNHSKALLNHTVSSLLLSNRNKVILSHKVSSHKVSSQQGSRSKEGLHRSKQHLSLTKVTHNLNISQLRSHKLHLSQRIILTVLMMIFHFDGYLRVLCNVIPSSPSSKGFFYARSKYCHFWTLEKFEKSPTIRISIITARKRCVLTD
jgi:hypothetical protein